MDTLRDIVIVLHLIGFAVIFGAWAAEAAARRFRMTSLMNGGLGLALLTGLILSAPWPADIELNYVKITVKLAVLIVIGALIGIGSSRQRSTGQAPPRAMFLAVGVLALTNAGLAVLW